MKKEFDLNKMRCAFKHPHLDLFYKKDSPQGMVDDIRFATHYVGKEQREAGLKEVMERYSSIKHGYLIFHYF